jgi:glutamine amidotransferase
MEHYTAIVDYGVGNLKSVSNAMGYLGLETRITSDRKELELADAIILPGVGAFPDAAEKLRGKGLDLVLKEQAQQANKPILGICLGMQLLFQQGQEVRPCEGLGFVKGTVEKIQTDRKLPHIGWNSLHFHGNSPLFQGLDEGAYVYFVHSFCGVAEDPNQVIATTDYGPSVVAAVNAGTVYGTQFHPEKSGEVGLQMLKNFASLNR